MWYSVPALVRLGWPAACCWLHSARYDSIAFRTPAHLSQWFATRCAEHDGKSRIPLAPDAGHAHMQTEWNTRRHPEARLSQRCNACRAEGRADDNMQTTRACERVSEKWDKWSVKSFVFGTLRHVL